MYRYTGTDLPGSAYFMPRFGLFRRNKKATAPTVFEVITPKTGRQSQVTTTMTMTATIATTIRCWTRNQISLHSKRASQARDCPLPERGPVDACVLSLQALALCSSSEVAMDDPFLWEPHIQGAARLWPKRLSTLMPLPTAARVRGSWLIVGGRRPRGCCCTRAVFHTVLVALVVFALAFLEIFAFFSLTGDIVAFIFVVLLLSRIARARFMARIMVHKPHMQHVSRTSTYTTTTFGVLAVASMLIERVRFYRCTSVRSWPEHDWQLARSRLRASHVPISSSP